MSKSMAVRAAPGDVHPRHLAMAGLDPAGHERCMDEPVDMAGHRGGQHCTDQQTCRCCGLTEHRGSYCSRCSSHRLDFHAPRRSEAQQDVSSVLALGRKTARPAMPAPAVVSEATAPVQTGLWPAAAGRTGRQARGSGVRAAGPQAVSDPRAIPENELRALWGDK